MQLYMAKLWANAGTLSGCCQWTPWYYVLFSAWLQYTRIGGGFAC